MKTRKPEARTSTRRNESTAKGLEIIEVMAAAPGSMRLQDISKAVQAPASTVLRFLKTLKDYNYAEQDPATLQYFLTFRFSHIADQVRRQVSFRDIVHPHLAEFSKTHGEASSLAVESDFLVVYVDVVEGPDRILQTLQRIGKTAPMHSTGVGKVLLLDKTGSEIDELIKSSGLRRLTSRTITSRKGLVAELGRVRRRGYALDNEECEEGVRCAAAPLRDHTGKIVAAISTSGPIARMATRRIEQLGREIVELSAKISKQLGYQPPAK